MGSSRLSLELWPKLQSKGGSFLAFPICFQVRGRICLVTLHDLVALSCSDDAFSKLITTSSFCLLVSWREWLDLFIYSNGSNA
jgi:hypothetical protein